MQTQHPKPLSPAKEQLMNLADEIRAKARELAPSASAAEIDYLHALAFDLRLYARDRIFSDERAQKMYAEYQEDYQAALEHIAESEEE